MSSTPASDLAHVRPWRAIDRRPSRKIRVGAVEVGGDAPITVQSMTNTPTADAAATIDQIRQLEDAGADIVRVSCPDEASTAALKTIVRAVRVPIVADIHFHYRRGVEAAEAGAACLRINPGNIGSKDRVREVIQAARDAGATAYLSKETEPRELARMLRSILADPKRGWMPSVALPSLTRREEEVLALLAQGMSNKAMASRLGLSPDTVKDHLENLYRKLEVRDRLAAVKRAMELGLITNR